MSRSEQEIRANWEACYTPRGYLSKAGARVLGDVPDLLDALAAARAEADRLREENTELRIRISTVRDAILDGESANYVLLLIDGQASE